MGRCYSWTITASCVPFLERERPAKRTQPKTETERQKKMNKIQVTDRATLDALYKDSAFTIEGLAPDDESLGKLAEWVKRLTSFKREVFYIIEGRTMNREYNLTGTNAYPEKDCTLVCIKLTDLVKPLALTMPRFQVGGRWFDDVVDNNARREAEKNGTED